MQRDRIEKTLGNLPACAHCHARVWRGGVYVCDTDKLDGEKYNQPKGCTLPRIVFDTNMGTVDVQKLAEDKIRALRKSGAFSYQEGD